MTGTTATLDEVQRMRRGDRAVAHATRVVEAAALRAGQSETLDRAQLRLQLGELEKLAAAERPTATITYERTAGPAPKRTLPAESFAHLPVRETVEIVPEAVQRDPSLYEKIGEERTFEVDLVPPQLFKREIVRAEVPALPGSQTARRCSRRRRRAWSRAASPRPG